MKKLLNIFNYLLMFVLGAAFCCVIILLIREVLPSVI